MIGKTELIQKVTVSLKDVCSALNLDGCVTSYKVCCPNRNCSKHSGREDEDFSDHLFSVSLIVSTIDSNKQKDKMCNGK